MTSNSTADNLCASTDTLCIIKQHELEIIIVPSLLLLATLVTLVALCFLRYCPEQKHNRITARQHYKSHGHTQRHSHGHNHSHKHNHRHNVKGIDAPPGINPLEHEELPMSVQQVQNVKSTPAAVPQATTERQQGAFSQITALPLSPPIKNNDMVSLYRARTNNKPVILRVLEDTASSSEKQHFLGFASFVSRLGPHPFLPALLGVVSVQPPLMIAVEELQHRELLGFLWRCRKDNSGLESSCDMTEKKIFTMAGQVASALDYLHSQSCIHGNVGARSVLVGGDLTAKLWGLGSAYYRKTQAGSPVEAEDMEMKKWQAPEALARRTLNQSSDVWSFGILLYEMVTLGDPPFAQVMASELLQYLQRGKHLKRPAHCSNSLFSIIRSCCHWNPQHRLTVQELITTLEAGEKSANGRTVIRVTEPIDVETYMRKAGYSEAYNHAML